MSMSREDVKRAFREAASVEFRSIPTDDSEIDFEFSKEFERKMDKLIKKERTLHSRFLNGTAKRIAVIAAALIILFAATFSISAARIPIIEFFVKVYDTFTEYFFEGNKNETIEKEYEITSLPEGFVLEDSFSDEQTVINKYRNSDNDFISFSQSVDPNLSFQIDDEHSKDTTVNISGNQVYLYSLDDSICAVWIESGYAFKIVCYGNFEESAVLDLIESVKYETDVL